MTGVLGGGGLCWLLWWPVWQVGPCLHCLECPCVRSPCGQGVFCVGDILILFWSEVPAIIFCSGCIDGLQSIQTIAEDQDLEEGRMFFDPFQVWENWEQLFLEDWVIAVVSARSLMIHCALYHDAKRKSCCYVGICARSIWIDDRTFGRSCLWINLEVWCLFRGENLPTVDDSAGW